MFNTGQRRKRVKKIGPKMKKQKKVDLTAYVLIDLTLLVIF